MNKNYYEVIVEGSVDLIRGFVLGFMEGRGIKGEAIFEEEQHIKVEGKLTQLIRLSGIKGKRIHIIVGTGFYQVVRDAFMNVQEKMDLKVVSVREIADAHFGFQYKAFNKELGEELKGIFADLPEGLRIEGDYLPEESLMPEGKGIESYAPLHEYELSARGEIHGPAREALDFYRKLELHDMVELDDIKLKYIDK